MEGDAAAGALEALRARKLVRQEEQEYGIYRLTQQGLELAERLTREVP